MNYRTLFARKCGLAGVLFSIVPFLLFGLILGAKYGLEAGSFIAGTLFPGPFQVEIANRLVMGGSMIAGIALSGAVHAAFFYFIFRAAGSIIAGGRKPEAETEALDMAEPDEAEEPRAA